MVRPPLSVGGVSAVPKVNTTAASNPHDSHPPGVWPVARRGVWRLLAPVQRFLAIEAASGVVLMLFAIAALWTHISVAGMAIGIGFTMALFIAQLAFPPGPLLETTKVAILSGSGFAGIVSLVIGYRILKTNHEHGQ